MKILIDMNLSPSWVEFFAASGFQSIHWSKVGEADASHDVIMDYAATNGFVIFTHDLILVLCSRTGSLASQVSFKFGRKMFSPRRSALSCYGP